MPTTGDFDMVRTLKHLALAAALTAAGTAHAQKAEVIHWWTSGGESAAEDPSC